MLTLKNENARIIDLAYTHSNEGDHNLAIDLLREAIESHPNNLTLRTALGIVFARAHRDKESERVLRFVLRRDPYHVEATSALGRLLDNSLRSEEAEQLFRHLLTVNPQCHQIVMDLGRLLLEEERYDEAFTVARHLIELIPEDSEAYMPLRHLLLLDEIRLENEMLDSDYSQKNWESLVSNLLEQYDLIKELQRFSNQNAVDSELNDLIQDELIRLKGRFKEVERILEKVTVQTSKQIRDSLKKAAAEISQH